MRSSLLKLTLGFGLVVAALAPVAACEYQMHSATADHAAPSQTAQAQPATQDQSN